LVSATSKIVLQGHLTDLGVQRLYVDRRHHSLAATRTEHIGSAALKLRFPRDLIGMYVELLGELRQCPIALNGGKRHRRFEDRSMIPPWSSLQVSPDLQTLACPPSGRNSTYRPVQISGMELSGVRGTRYYGDAPFAAVRFDWHL
jgi:hypothetical protein